MDPAMRQALAEYGRTIRSKGWRAGEALIRSGESRFRDFRKWAHALGIVLRARELIQSRVPKE